MSETTIGIAYRRYKDPFYLKLGLKDRLSHFAALGQTGTGKSTLLHNMITQDAFFGHGLCLIDPHGDLAAALHTMLPEDHIYWNAADSNNPFGFNPLRQVPLEMRSLASSGFIEALKQQWSDAWGPRMEHLLRYALLLLLEKPNTDLRDISKLFVHQGFRRQMTNDIEDEQVRHFFWRSEFPKLNFQSSADGVASVANKLGAFLAHPGIRKSLTEPREAISFRSTMDKGGIVLVNLAKGKLGADSANVLGGLISATIMNAAFTRTDLPELARKPFFFYADEFASFTTKSFGGMLSEARKLGLGLVLAQQFLSQIDAEVRDAMFGNVGTMAVFRVGAMDAPHLVRLLHPFTEMDLINQQNRRAIVRLIRDGEPQSAFSMSTFKAN